MACGALKKAAFAARTQVHVIFPVDKPDWYHDAMKFTSAISTFRSQRRAAVTTTPEAASAPSVPAKPVKVCIPSSRTSFKFILIFFCIV